MYYENGIDFRGSRNNKYDDLSSFNDFAKNAAQAKKNQDTYTGLNTGLNTVSQIGMQSGPWGMLLAGVAQSINGIASGIYTGKQKKLYNQMKAADLENKMLSGKVIDSQGVHYLTPSDKIHAPTFDPEAPGKMGLSSALSMGSNAKMDFSKVNKKKNDSPDNGTPDNSNDKGYTNESPQIDWEGDMLKAAMGVSGSNGLGSAIGDNSDAPLLESDMGGTPFNTNFSSVFTGSDTSGMFGNISQEADWQDTLGGFGGGFGMGEGWGAGAGGTMSFEKGGAVTVKGGRGKDDIALVDTTTGKDTGVRVQKNEMIVFNDKVVKALKSAVKKNDKDLVYGLIKDQMKQKPKVEEGKMKFAGGGLFGGKTQEQILKDYYALKDVSAVGGNQKFDKLRKYEKYFKDNNIDYKPIGLFRDKSSKELVAESIANPKANEIVRNIYGGYGNPFTDKDIYRDILSTKLSQLVKNGNIQEEKKMEAAIRALDEYRAKKGQGINRVMKSDIMPKNTQEKEIWDNAISEFEKADKTPIDQYRNPLSKIPGIAETTYTRQDASSPKNEQGGDLITRVLNGLGIADFPITTYPYAGNSTTTTTPAQTGSGGKSNTKPRVKQEIVSPEQQDLKGIWDDFYNKRQEELKAENDAKVKRADIPKTKQQETNSKSFDWQSALGYAGDAFRLGMGLYGANKPLPSWQPTSEWNEYMGKMRMLSNLGFTPEQRAEYNDQAASQYLADTQNIKNVSGGSGGVILGNLGRANADRYRAGLQISLADRQVQQQNLRDYGSWLARDEQYRKGIFDKYEYDPALLTKKAGMQLANDAMHNMQDRADYEKYYGDNSQIAKLLEMQLQEQGLNNDILATLRQPENLQALIALAKTPRYKDKESATLITG